MKKIISIGLSALLAVSTLAGCTSSPSSSDSSTGNTANQETVKLRAIARTSGTDSGWEKVNEEINKYLKEKVNAEVTYELVTYGDYDDKVNLTVSSGEEIDLLSPSQSQLLSFARQGAMEPLNELLESDGKGILELYDETILQSCALDGDIYAVPTNRDQASGFVYMYRPDMNEKYDLGLDKVTSWEELEQAFAKFKEQEPTKYCVHASSMTSPFGKVYSWDKLGGNDFGVLMDMGQSMTVENLYATDYYSQWIHKFRSWYEKGYLPQDALTSNLSERDGMTSGNSLGLMMNWHPKMVTEATQNNGVELVKAPIEGTATGFMTTTTLNNVSWGISKTSKSPQKAMQVINLMYTDEKLINMLSYGLEGENYVFVDEEKGIIDYPQGVTSSTQTVDVGTGWQWGNMLISYVWNGGNPTVWDEMAEYNKTAVRSKALGFVFDPTNIQNEMTACTNVYEKYAPGLERGVVDPDEVLPVFLDELKSAGIDRIIEEKQTQLDEWAANQ